MSDMQALVVAWNAVMKGQWDSVDNQSSRGASTAENNNPYRSAIW